MKKLPALLLLSGALAGCTTTTSYHALAPAGTPTPADYPIPLYTPEMEPPRPCIVLGDIAIGHTHLTIQGGGISDEMHKVMRLAHAKGADAVQIISVQPPGFSSPDFSIHARLLRYADVWEEVPLSENDLLAYLQKNRATLDPIEGIWSDGPQHRLGIVRNSSRPGRDFIAFTLTPDSPAWLPGYKKMDIARGDAPGVYELKYYKDDFSWSDLSVTLDQNRRFQFILNSGDKQYPMVFTKLTLPPPAR